MNLVRCQINANYVCRFAKPGFEQFTCCVHYQPTNKMFTNLARTRRTKHLPNPLLCVFQPFAMCAYAANENIRQFALCVNA